MGGVIYNLPMRPLRLREDKELIQDHTASERQSQTQNTGRDHLDLCQTVSREFQPPTKEAKNRGQSLPADFEK